MKEKNKTVRSRVTVIDKNMFLSMTVTADRPKMVLHPFCDVTFDRNWCAERTFDSIELALTVQKSQTRILYRYHVGVIDSIRFDSIHSIDSTRFDSIWVLENTSLYLILVLAGKFKNLGFATITSSGIYSCLPS
jgi:hypothetical protein